MDSVSQFVLGAAVGEVVLGKKIGNQAILWGGLAGTIPDLDVFFLPLFDDPVTQLGVHRGISHSFFFAIMAGILFGYLTWLLYKRGSRETTLKEWSLLYILGFATHAILDSFTTWGTQLFLPFSDYRVAINNIFVADPLYTIPFLVFLIITAFYKRNDPRRRRYIMTGISVSCIYLLLTFAGKFIATQAFKAEMKERDIEYSRILTAPTPLNSILWYAVAEDDSGYHIGVYSLLDGQKAIDFEYFERRESLIDDIRHTKEIDRLIWMAQGYYAIRYEEEGLIFYDMKFGKRDFDNMNGKLKDRVIFPFKLTKHETGKVEVEQLDNRPSGEELGKAFSQLWNRMLGV